MSGREDARRLLDEVPDERVPVAVELLRRLLSEGVPAQPRRRFRTVGVFEAESDLGASAKEIARRELGE
jgi:hypothetical protein